MLRIICGGFGSGKSSKVLELVSEKIEQAAESDKKIYLIVPEQDTVRVELEATKKLPPIAPLCFEVINFSRLCDTVFRMLGGLSYKYADTTSKTLVMWQTLRSLGGLIDGSTDPCDDGVINSMLKLSTELRAKGVTTGKLESAATQTGDEVLRRQLSDVALILSVYESALESLYTDSEKDIDRVCDLLVSNKIFTGTDIFIDGFASFTAPQLRLIGRLLSDGVDVTLTLPYRDDKNYSYCVEAKEALFALIALSKDAGTLYEVINMGDSKRAEGETLRYISDSLYLEPCSEKCQCDGSVEIYECEDIREEAEAVATLVARKIREGARYRDIAIIARRAENYSGVLDVAFERHGIPCFFSQEQRAEAYHIVRFLYSAMSIAVSGFRRDDVIAYLKTGFAGVSSDEADIFEKYVSTWKISGKRIVSENPFLQNPRGYTDACDQKSDAILKTVNHVREKLCDTIGVLYDNVKGTRKVSDMCSALWHFILKMSVKEKAEEEARALSALGDEQGARELEGVFRTIVEVFDTLLYAVGDETVDIREFYKIFRICLKSKSVSVIPTSADAITVGSAHMLRTGDKKHVFVIGVNEGCFPEAVRDDGYFDISKRKKLSELGISLDCDMELDISKELFFFARAVSCAKNTLTLTFNNADGKMSSALINLKKMLGIDGHYIYSKLPILMRVYDKSSCQSAIDTLDVKKSCSDAGVAALSVISGENKYDGYLLSEALSDEITDEIFGGGINMTQARLEQYAECHFAYLLRYILRLEGEYTADFDALDIGNFVHSCIDHMTGKLFSFGKLRKDISDDEISAYISEYVNGYMSGLCPDSESRNARLQYLSVRIEKAVGIIVRNIIGEFSESQFNVISHEMKIEPRDALRYTLKDGRELSIFGTVDRVDAFVSGGDAYVRVVDYKTGTKTFSLSDIKKGKNLQLLLYLFAVCHQTKESSERMFGKGFCGRVIPAGMLYYLCIPKDSASEVSFSIEQTAKLLEKKLGRVGIFTDNEDILRAMEPDLNGKYIPVKFTEKSGVKPSSARLPLQSEEGFEMLYEMTKEKVIEMAEDLCRGKINVTQDVSGRISPCDRCEMRSVCRNYTEKYKSEIEKEEDANSFEQ